MIEARLTALESTGMTAQRHARREKYLQQAFRAQKYRQEIAANTRKLNELKRAREIEFEELDLAKKKARTQPRYHGTGSNPKCETNRLTGRTHPMLKKKGTCLRPCRWRC